MRATAFEPDPIDSRLTTAMLSDSLDELGVRHQVLPQRLAPITAGSRAFGRAATITFGNAHVADPQHPYDDAIDFIDSLRRGELVVISTGSSNASAFWGELFSVAAIGAGAVGIITDGNLRDTDKIADLPFPAFSASRRPIDYRGRTRVVGRRTSVLLGGVSIDPGDLVMADDDGVVVIPGVHEVDVLKLARTRAAAENLVLGELREGASLREVWDKHKVL